MKIKFVSHGDEHELDLDIKKLIKKNRIKGEPRLKFYKNISGIVFISDNNTDIGYIRNDNFYPDRSLEYICKEGLRQIINYMMWGDEK